MTMTKSRRAGASVRSSKRYRPVVADLVGADEVEGYIAEQQRQIDDAANSKTLGAEAFGRVAALQFNMDVLMEAAFQRIAALESELKKSKAAPLPYQGVWKQGQEYLPGQFLTFAGSVWHVDKKTSARPGDDPAAYTLAVKHGRDGKDARP